MPKKLTTKEFIERARKVHGDRYNYSKAEYNGTHTKVCIICPIHGEFWQTPHNHLAKKQGCPKCSGNTVKKNEDFINDAKKIHGSKYDYSKIVYKGNKTKICIICPKHGEFWQTPNVHLLGHGCPKCKSENTKKRLTRTFEDFVKRAREVHGDKYTYHKSTYTFLKSKTLITCPKHGDFLQRGQDHINGHGCAKCNSFWKSTEQFVEQARKIHGDRYDYSKVEYKNKNSNVVIICKKHGEFEQIAQNHLKGCNCPKCACSKIEDEVMRFLVKNNFSFTHRAHFEWLGKKHLDFYLPDYNVAIECQGIEHFESHDFFGGRNVFLNTNERDKEKKELCTTNNIKLIYYTNLKKYNSFLGEKLIKNNEDLIKAIKEK